MHLKFIAMICRLLCVFLRLSVCHISASSAVGIQYVYCILVTVSSTSQVSECNVFLPARRYASAGYSHSNVSVRLSVRPSRAGIVSKQRKLAA